MLKAATILIGASAAASHPLRHAKSLHRLLANNDNNNNGYLTSSHSIRFSQCIDLKLLDEDLFDEEVVEYVQNNEIVSTKSYILFHLCESDECYYESQDDLYFVDLRSFLANIGVYRSQERGRYCEACLEFEEYCNSGDDDGNGGDYSDDGQVAANGDDAVQQEEEVENDNVQEEQENNNAADEQVQEEDAAAAEGNNDAEQQRKLFATTHHRALTNNNAIDCNQCNAFNCYNETYTTNDDDITDLVTNLANCLPTNQYWNNEQLYISAMCTPYGDGVELAVFLDNECTVYTNKATFANVYQNYIQENGLDDLSNYVEMFVKSGLEQDMSCEDVEYVTPEEAAAADYNDDDDANNNNNGQVNEYCQQIFNQGAVEFNQCYSNNNDDESSFGNRYNPNDDEYSWYTYDMTYDQAKDLQDVCAVVYKMEGEYYYSYDAEKSGTWYSRDKSGSIKSKQAGYAMVEFSPMAIALLVLLGVGIVGVSAFYSCRKSKARRIEPLYQGGAMI